MHFFFHSPRKSRECMLHLCVAAWGFTHFLQHLLSSKCLASGALHRLGNFLLLASFGDNCSEIYRSFQPLTSSAYAVCKRKVSWLFSRGQSLFGEISIFFPFAPFCLIYFVSSTCFELMWEGRKKMLMISVAIGFSKRLETHDTTCFNLKDVS